MQKSEFRQLMDEIENILDDIKIDFAKIRYKEDRIGKINFHAAQRARVALVEVTKLGKLWRQGSLKQRQGTK